mgnify:CR=1 FL=1
MQVKRQYCLSFEKNLAVSRAPGKVHGKAVAAWSSRLGGQEMTLQLTVGILAHMREETAKISAAVATAEERRRQTAEEEFQALLPTRIVIRGSGTAFKRSMGDSFHSVRAFRRCGS